MPLTCAERARLARSPEMPLTPPTLASPLKLGWLGDTGMVLWGELHVGEDGSNEACV